MSRQTFFLKRATKGSNSDNCFELLLLVSVKLTLFILCFNADLREEVCYGTVSSSGCGNPYGGRYKKVDCCCSVVGSGWGNPCQECPLANTGKVK